MTEAPLVTPAAVDPARRRIGLLVICLTTMIVFFNITATFAVLPSMQHALHASSTSVVWVTSVFSLVLASLVLTAGAVGDRFGRRTVFAAGTLILGVGGAIILADNSITGAIAGQAVMGFGGSLLLPNGLAMISHAATSPHGRAQSISLWAASTGIGMAIGPVVSGAILKGFAWNAPYLVIVIAAVVAFVAVWLFTDNSKHPTRTLDLPGTALGTVAVTALVFAIIQGGHESYGKTEVLVALAIAVVAAALFIVVETRVEGPMMDLRLFRSPAFSGLMLVGIASLFVFTSCGLMYLYLFQRGQQLSPLEAGLRILPLFLAFIVFSALGARAVAKVGVKATLTTGLVVVAAVSLGMQFVRTDDSFGIIVAVLIVSGAGIGLLVAPTTAAAVASVPVHDAGMASAMTNMFRQLGSVLGASIVGTALTSTFAHRLPTELAHQHLPQQQIPAAVNAVNTGETAANTPSSVVALVSRAAGDALTTATHHGFLIVGVAAVIIAVPTVLFVAQHPTPPGP